jgi:nucleotide-binding universal stress UspA family protein
MFDKIIVGVDGESGGRDALALARTLAPSAGEIGLAHVYIESLLPARGSPGVFAAGELRHSRELLERERAAAGVETTLYPVASHDVGRGLHELAESIGADLIVVGSSRRGLVGRVLQGDDMRAALNAAPCAVAVAPGSYAERRGIMSEIGVGYDGSPESLTALAAARQIAAGHGARVSVFEAVPAPSHGFANARHPAPVALETAVEQALERLRALGEVTPHAAFGDPAEELALYGASVDLLIVGSRNYGPLGRLIHGRTTRHLASTARCPLLVMPRSAATEHAPDATSAEADPATLSATTEHITQSPS